MSVLQLSKFYPPILGGIETTVRDIAVGLTKRNWRVSVLCANTESRTVVETGEAGVSVVRAGSFGTVASASMAPALVKRLIRQPRHAVVHVHLPDPMTNLALFIARPSAKLVVHWHSDIVKQKQLLKMYAPLQNWLLRRADRIVSTSPPYAASSPWLQPFVDKIRFVPSCIVDPRDGLDEAMVARQVEEIRARYPDKRIVFALGRMTYYKGFSVLVQAAAKLSDDVVVLIGGAGELLEPLQEQARALGVADKVQFLGKVPEVLLGAYYRAADVFCLPSIMRSEAFGLVLVEAMAHGVPVVATRIPGSGVPWVNQDGETGLNAEPGDPASLAAALDELLHNPELASRLGKGGRKRFEDHFTVGRMIDAVESVYAELGVNARTAD